MSIAMVLVTLDDRITFGNVDITTPFVTFFGQEGVFLTYQRLSDNHLARFVSFRLYHLGYAEFHLPVQNASLSRIWKIYVCIFLIFFVIFN